MTLGEVSRESESIAWNRHCRPAIGYSQALSSWFVHDGQAYPVKNAPQSVFTAWLESVIPRHWTEADKALNIATEPENSDYDERMLCRWFSLCGVLRGRKPRAVVYASEQEAISSLKK
jgi:hypothetical protein